MTEADELALRREALGNCPRASWWVASVSALAGQLDRDPFEQGCAAAWGKAVDSLSGWPNQPGDELPAVTGPTLYLGWHFPELPRVFASLRDNGVRVVVGQLPSWLAPFGDLTIDLSLEAGAGPLMTALANGQSVALIVDHALPGSVTTDFPFLGLRRKMADGALQAAVDAEYQVQFLAPRAGRVEVAYQWDPSSVPADPASTVNSWLENEVTVAPQRWLVWPQLHLMNG
jgi:hypothetical protein